MANISWYGRIIELDRKANLIRIKRPGKRGHTYIPFDFNKPAPELYEKVRVTKYKLGKTWIDGLVTLAESDIILYDIRKEVGIK